MSEAESQHIPIVENSESQGLEEDFRATVKEALHHLYNEVSSIKSNLEKLVLDSEQANSQMTQRSFPAPEAGSTELSFSNRQLQEVQEKYNREIDTLRRELNKKTLDNKNLHSIIQSGQDTGGLSDEDVDKWFGSLKTEIQNFSRSTIKKFKSKAVLTTMKESDKGFWIDAFIADQIHNLIFKKELFDLDDKEIRRALSHLEYQLRQKQAPRDEITSWRAETVRIVKYLDQPCRQFQIHSISDTLIKQLDNYVRFEDDKKPGDELDTLCTKAYDLALTLREHKITFEWRQREYQDWSMNDSNFNIHRGYQELNEHGQAIQYRILFGPVFKISGHDALCIRKGELLASGTFR